VLSPPTDGSHAWAAKAIRAYRQRPDSQFQPAEGNERIATRRDDSCGYTAGMAKLYFYYSAMNAGKSTTLLQSAHNYRERGMRTLILTPRLDDRQGVGIVSSRIGLKAQATAFERDDDLDRLVRGDIDANGTLHCVLVDEAQFLGKAQVWQLTEIVDALNIPVLAYGLRTDFRGELFEGSQYLLAWADELSEIKTICHTGSKATMVVRVDDQGHAVTEGAQVEIGGNERYVSVSRAEFKRLTRGESTLPSSQPTLPIELPLSTD
jgi:thymidine kinase